jgi:hypothetical protein
MEVVQEGVQCTCNIYEKKPVAMIKERESELAPENTFVKSASERFEVRTVLDAYKHKEQSKNSQAVTKTFELFQTQFSELEKEDDHVIFSLSTETLKEFMQIFVCIHQVTSIFHFHFTERGLHSDFDSGNEQAKITLHLSRSFFHSYSIDPGLEIDLTISLDDFCPKLNKTKRKDTFEPILFVLAPSGIGIRCTTSNRGEVIYSFSPKVLTKVSQGEQLERKSGPTAQCEAELDSPYFLLIPSERFAVNATSYAKNKQSQHANYLYLDYKYATNLLSISSSTKTLAEDGTQFPPLLLGSRPLASFDRKKEERFKGTFSSNVLFHFSKLSPILILGPQERSSTLVLKTYFRELSPSVEEMSYLQIGLRNEDDDSAEKENVEVGTKPESE